MDDGNLVLYIFLVLPLFFFFLEWYWSTVNNILLPKVFMVTIFHKPRSNMSGVLASVLCWVICLLDCWSEVDKMVSCLFLVFVLISCGSGLSGDYISEEGHCWVGIDISPAMLGECFLFCASIRFEPCCFGLGWAGILKGNNCNPPPFLPLNRCSYWERSGGRLDACRYGSGDSLQTWDLWWLHQVGMCCILICSN